MAPLQRFPAETAWNAEKAARFLRLETGEFCRLEISGNGVGLFDAGFQASLGMRRQAEAYVDRRFEPALHHLVATANNRLEGRNHVADHIFRGQVKAPSGISSGLAFASWTGK